MGGPTGNQFWKQRSKHGRDKLFATPELLWEAACQYFQWCEDNPFLEAEQQKIPTKPFKGEDGEWIYPTNIIELPKMRPFTMQGLCLFLDCNTGYFRTFKSQLPEGEKDFNAVITRIEETVYNQKFSGAAAGFLNANIIARDLGLTDKQEQKIDQTITGKVGVTVVSSGIPLSNRESDVNPARS